MRTASIAAVLCLALAAAFSCSDTGDSTGGSGGSGSGGTGGTGGGTGTGPFTLTVSGTGYSPHVDTGKLYAALVDLGQMKVTARLDPPAHIEADGTFSFEMGDVLEKDVAYRLDYFAERQGVGTPEVCDPADHRWSTNIPPVQGDVVLPLTHNLNFSDVVCASFAADPGPYDLSFFGTNYTSHVGEVIRVKLVDVETDQVAATLDPPATVAEDATWSFQLHGVLERGVPYKLVYFADHDPAHNGACDAPPDDHVWSLSDDQLQNPIQDVVEHVEHLAQFDATACKYFP